MAKKDDDKMPRKETDQRNLILTLRKLFKDFNDMAPLYDKINYWNGRNNKGDQEPNVLILNYFVDNPDHRQYIRDKVIQKSKEALNPDNVILHTFVTNPMKNCGLSEQMHMDPYEKCNFSDDDLKNHTNLLIEIINVCHPDIILILGKPLSHKLSRLFCKNPDKTSIFPHDFDEEFELSSAFESYCLNKNISVFCIDDPSFFNDLLKKQDENAYTNDEDLIKFLKNEKFHRFYSKINSLTEDLFCDLKTLKELAKTPKKERLFTLVHYIDSTKIKTKEIIKDELDVEFDVCQKKIQMLQKLIHHAFDKQNNKVKKIRLKKDGSFNLTANNGRRGCKRNASNNSSTN